MPTSYPSAPCLLTRSAARMPPPRPDDSLPCLDDVLARPDGGCSLPASGTVEERRASHVLRRRSQERAPPPAPRTKPARPACHCMNAVEIEAAISDLAAQPFEA